MRFGVGSRLTKARGCSLLESLMSVKGFNECSVSTFRKNGRESICRLSLMDNMNWLVCDEHTHSDHQTIFYSVKHAFKEPDLKLLQRNAR